MATWQRTPAGDVVFPTLGNGPSAIVTDPDQCAAIRINDGLQMWLGNWKLDTAQGTPWQTFIGQKPQLVALGNMLRKAILLLGAPTVLSVTQLALVLRRTVRDLGYQFTAPSMTGATLVGGSNGPAGKPYVLVQ